MSIEVGQVIAHRYRVDAFLGRGGMAEVFKVWDQSRSVYLAMKVLSSDLAEDKVFLRRFKREAETLAKLKHPSIVRFYELQEEGALAFILMDFIDGPSLRREIKETAGPFTPQRILEVMRPICAALDYAHRSNIVHCDIKSSNILEDRHGKVYLSDFGIARMMDTTSSSITMAGAGTANYMAPEQIRGESPTPQMDIYALGVLLFELATGGERPFTGERATITGTTAEKIRWEHLHTVAATPSQFNPGVPPQLDQIILRCLEKNPTRRFGSAIEMFAELERFLGWMVSSRLDLRNVSQTNNVKPPPSPKVPVQRPKPWIYMSGAAIVLIFLSAILVFGSGGPKIIAKTDEPKTNTPSPVLPTKVTLVSTQIHTVTPKPIFTSTITPTITQTSTLVISTCSSSLACSQIGQTCQSSSDGMRMICVPAGNFIMGTDLSGVKQNFVFLDELMQTGQFVPHSVALDAFWIDQTEVTNAMFAKFVSARSYLTSAEKAGLAYVFSYDFKNEKTFPYWKEVKGASWLHPFGPGSDIQGKDNHPVVSVSWIDAYQYCQWANRQLPSEAQWEKAAKGNNPWFFPWGNQFPTTSTKYANFADASLSTDFSETQINDGFEYSAPVGAFSRGNSPYGVMDMSGNAMEWVEDYFYENAYKGNANNPRYIDDLNNAYLTRVIRGGSWEAVLVRIRASDRESMIAIGRRDDLGFRCAISAGK